MSQENVDLTRRAFQAFEDRDLDALLAILDDDVSCRSDGQTGYARAG